MTGAMDRRLVAGALLIALAVIAVIAAYPLGPWRDGPVKNASHITITFPLPGDQIFVWGMALPPNPTQSEIRVTSIEPVGVAGLEVLGAVIDYPVRQPDGICLMYGDQTAPSFPPSGITTRPVKGTVLARAEPTGGTCGIQPEVLVGIRRPPDSAAGRIDALRMVYEHDGRTYELLVTYSLDICRPTPGATFCPGTELR
jgi:hypothetical protein